MRLKQAINEKISMYDRIIFALSATRRPMPVGNPYLNEVDEMVNFLEDERQRLRTEAQELDDGTHWIFADSPPWVNGDNVSTG